MPRVQVMIVDDHPVVRAGLCALVDGRETMTVAVEAGTGEEALLRLEEVGAQIDVIIMDLRMGAGVSGIEATRLIRERCDIPVLIMTAFDTQADVVAALEVGAIGYLLKDCPADEIARAVEDAAAGRSVLSPSVIAQMMKRIASPATALTPREIEILELLSGGATNRQLARRLFISEATVKTHLVHIFDKLGADNRTQAIERARDERVI